MIRYELQCQKGHRFDTWFRDSGLADRQLRQGKVECVACGSRRVEKALMAPRLTRNAGPGSTSHSHMPENTHIAAPDNIPDNMKSTTTAHSIPTEAEAKEMLRGMRKYIEANFDNVGSSFAEEARKIHKGESERQAIYGKASPEEHRALYEEGIEIGILPWIPENDA